MKRFAGGFVFGLVLSLILSAAMLSADYGAEPYFARIATALERIATAMEGPKSKPKPPKPCHNRVGATIPCVEEPFIGSVPEQP